MGLGDAPQFFDPDKGRGICASAAALAQPGAREVTLFTDLRNPTSNKIYAEIGYRPARDYIEVTLAPAD